nr:ribonuclease H-like domain-containing protein [Tanacetum cinerariifolium]
MVTGANAGIFKPLERMNCHVTTTSPLPRSHVHALRDPNWKEAMLHEYNALITNETWVLIPRLANVNVVRSIQQQGIDCDEAFSPVVKPATIHTVLSLAVTRDWPIHQLDVKNAFLHGYEFAMTDLGSLNYFLGISAKRSKSGLFLSQSKFAEEILKRAHMQHYNPCKTLVDTESKLGSDGDPQICLYMHDPRDPYFTALKRILRYVHADWAGCPVTRRSTFGYCVFFGDNLLSWSAKRHVTLSRSSAEAEYRSVANVVPETAWIQNLLLELNAPLTTATLVYCNNVSVVYLSTNPVQHQRTKHIKIDIHCVRDYVASGQVRVLHVPSRFQYADIFTKGLPSALFLEFRSSLNVCGGVLVNSQYHI